MAVKYRLKNYEASVKKAVDNCEATPDMPADCKLPITPQRRRIFSTDPTSEKLVKLCAANPRGILIIRDELSGWLGSMDQYKNGAGSDRAFYLQAYGGRAWTQDRVKDTEPTVVPHLLCSIVGTIQPDRLKTLMTNGDDDGLSARFLYCWPEPVPPLRPRMIANDSAAVEALQRLRGMSWLADPEPEVVPFSEAAQVSLQEFREYVAGMEYSASGILLSWTGKLPGLAVRLALILTFLDWCAESGIPEPSQIDIHAVERAIKFLKEFALPMARRTFGKDTLPEVERDARAIGKWLLRQEGTPATINAKALRRMANGPGICDSRRMDAALRRMTQFGWVRPAKRQQNTSGRPANNWQINPAFVNQRDNFGNFGNTAKGEKITNEREIAGGGLILPPSIMPKLPKVEISDSCLVNRPSSPSRVLTELEKLLD